MKTKVLQKMSNELSIAHFTFAGDEECHIFSLSTLEGNENIKIYFMIFT